MTCANGNLLDRREKRGPNSGTALSERQPADTAVSVWDIDVEPVQDRRLQCGDASRTPQIRRGLTGKKGSVDEG